MKRMRKLSLTLQTQSPVVDSLLDILKTHSAPILKQFSLTYPLSEVANHPLTKLFGGTHPVLRELKLVRCNLSWDNLPPIETLVNLYIEGALLGNDPIQCPSIVQLASILGNSPNVEYLNIYGIIPPSPTDFIIGSPILLPRLSKMGIQSEIGQCYKLLNNISYPATSSVSIRSLGTTNNTPADVVGILRRVLNPERLIEVQPSIQYLRVTPSSPNYGDGTFAIEAWDDPGSHDALPSSAPKIDLRVCMDDYGSRTNHMGFWNILPLEGLHTLDIGYSDLQKSLWIELCARLEHLTILKLGMLMNDGPVEALEVLSSAFPAVSKEHGQDSPKNPPLLYFPALRGLSISDWNFRTLLDGVKISKSLNQLITALETRKALGAGVEVLDIQYCRYFFASGVEELEKVVPLVTWDGLENMTESEEEEEVDDEYYSLPHY